MRRHPDRATVLYELFPSRWDDDPVARARTVFAGLAGVQDVALEWTATESGLRFYVRAVDDAAALAVLGQIRVAYPQADFDEVPIEGRPHLDPLHVAGHELASLVQLHLDRDAALPLDTDARHGEPLTGVLAAAVAATRGDVRVVGQVVVGHPPRPGWATGWLPKLKPMPAKVCSHIKPAFSRISPKTQPVS